MTTDSCGSADRPASSIIAAARPDSPTRESENEDIWVGIVAVKAIAAMTTTAQSTMARHGCRALHLATFTVAVVGFMGLPLVWM